MVTGLLTLEDFEVDNKIVLLRVDINSPLDPKTGAVLDNARIKNYLPTLQRLSASKVVMLAHQSRPGKSDFTTLERHSQVLRKLLKRPVKYVDDIFGSCAKKEIESLKNGEVLILENVRFSSEETSQDICNRSPEAQASTHLVRRLSQYVHIYVNDAFAVSHRSQPSVVGFPEVLPSLAGPTMEKEIEVLSAVLNSKEAPRVFALGGAKAEDSFLITKNVLERKVADKVLLSGVASIVVLIALSKKVGRENEKLVRELGYAGSVSDAKHLMERFPGKIVLPVDMAYEENGERKEADINEFPDKRALDIGSKTISLFSKEIKKAKVVIAKGPAGVFEVNGFSKGTEGLLKAVASSQAMSVIGGGHMGTVAEMAGIKGDITHVASGGGATVSFLSNQPLPGIEALKKASEAKG